VIATVSHLPRPGASTRRSAAVLACALGVAACGRVNVVDPDAASGPEAGDAAGAGGDADGAGPETAETKDGPLEAAGQIDGPDAGGDEDAARVDAGDADAESDVPEVPLRPAFPCDEVITDRWTYYLATDSAPWHTVKSHDANVLNEPATRQLRLTNGDVIQRDALQGSYFFEFDLVTEGTLAFFVGFADQRGFLPAIVRSSLGDIFLTGWDYDLDDSGSVGAFHGMYFSARPLHVTAFVKAGAGAVALRVDLPSGATYRSGFIPVDAGRDGGAPVDVATPRLIGGAQLMADHPARLSTLVGCQRLSDSEIDLAYAL
jgi:hypothetical protein